MIEHMKKVTAYRVCVCWGRVMGYVVKRCEDEGESLGFNLSETEVMGRFG